VKIENATPSIDAYLLEEHSWNMYSREKRPLVSASEDNSS